MFPKGLRETGKVIVVDLCWTSKAITKRSSRFCAKALIFIAFIPPCRSLTIMCIRLSTRFRQCLDFLLFQQNVRDKISKKNKIDQVDMAQFTFDDKVNCQWATSLSWFVAIARSRSNTTRGKTSIIIAVNKCCYSWIPPIFPHSIAFAYSLIYFWK